MVDPEDPNVKVPFSASIAFYKKQWIRENLKEGEFNDFLNKCIDRLMKGRETPLRISSPRIVVLILLAAIGTFGVSLGVSLYAIAPGVGLILLIPFAGFGVILLVISFFNIVAEKREAV